MKDILPLVFTFILVILILYLSYVFTKFIGKRSMRLKSPGNMKIVDRLSVAQDKSVMVLKADKRFYLLSVTPSDIKLIANMDEFEEKEEAYHEEGFSESLDFKSILIQALPKKKK